jgi:glyoxalase family protein
MQLTGLHHITAITARAPHNVDFYTQVLGLRLVKKTVNQDDVSAYHLFYGDAHGSAGTEVTFFDWPHTAPNHNGAGSIAQVALRVPSRASLDWWAGRLADSGVFSTVE